MKEYEKVKDSKSSHLSNELECQDGWFYAETLGCLFDAHLTRLQFFQNLLVVGVSPDGSRGFLGEVAGQPGNRKSG